MMIMLASSAFSCVSWTTCVLAALPNSDDRSLEARNRQPQSEGSSLLETSHAHVAWKRCPQFLHLCDPRSPRDKSIFPLVQPGTEHSTSWPTTSSTAAGDSEPLGLSESSSPNQSMRCFAPIGLSWRCFLHGVSSETPPTATNGFPRCCVARDDARRADAGVSGEGLRNDPSTDPLTLRDAVRVL